MNKLNIEGIKLERIQIEVTDNPNGVTIKFSGDIDMEDPSLVLDPFFDRLHDQVMAEKIPEVAANFKELNFLNSSGIKAVAKWIMKLCELSDSERYNIVIIQNKEITWQVTSLPTLTFLVPGAVKVE